MSKRAEVRRYFQGKYRCILVDEFQDTDPLQAETIVRLCAADGGEADWRRAKLRPGALFVVGDPKQSIYRFRRADITMYDDVKQHVFAGVRTIVQNFRSASSIIAWVNRTFEQLIAEQTGVQPAYIGLEHHPAYVRENGVMIVRGVTSNVAAEIRRAEAEALAGLISREIGGGGWMVRTGHSAGQQPAKWRDVAVLIPSRTELYIYEDAFARALIPYRHEGGRSFFVRQEVRELVAVLHVMRRRRHLTTIVVGQFVGQVFATEQPVAARDGARGYFVSVWPAPSLGEANGAIDWPPPLVVNDALLQDISVARLV